MLQAKRPYYGAFFISITDIAIEKSVTLERQKPRNAGQGVKIIGARYDECSYDAEACPDVNCGLSGATYGFVGVECQVWKFDERNEVADVSQ